MPDGSSAEAGGLAPRARAWLVVFHYLPLLHAAMALVPPLLAAAGTLAPPWALLGPAALWLLPPLAVRLALRAAPFSPGEHAAGSRTFLAWWFCAQWQVLFQRFPFLEELLRVVPTLYSAWLRAFGARIGRRVYWSPGVVLFDRQLIEVGEGAVLGAGARLVPHYLGKDPAGAWRLTLAPVRVGREAIVGGHALLAPGSQVPPGAATRAGRPLLPLRGAAGGSS